MSGRLLPIVLFGLTLAVYVAVLPPTILPGDSGELIAASRTLSIAHPPGYPLYVMLGKIFSSAITLGTMAYRYNLLSAIIASLTVTLFYFVVTNLGVGRLIGFGMSIVLSATELFWLQAVSAEVYSLTAFFAVLLLLIGTLATRLGRGAYLLLAYTAGLAISHHLTLIYAVISALVLIVVRARVLPSRRTVIFGFLLFLVGLSIWLYIPVRADHRPPLTWEGTSEFKGFLSHILASRYKWRLKTFDLLERVVDIARFARMAVRSAGLPLSVLAVCGVIGYLKRLRSVAACLCLIFFFAAHYAVYNIPDIEAHVFPFLIGLAALAALGAETAARWLFRSWSRAGIAVTACVLALAGYSVASIRPRQDKWFAYDYNLALEQSAIEAVGGHPVLITSGDLAALSFYYRALVEKRDLTLFVVGASDPSVLGADGPLETQVDAARAAEAKFGPDRVVVFSKSDVDLLSMNSQMCGMVWVPGPVVGLCQDPGDYAIRGAGAEPRDFFSRALSAEYYLHLAFWHAEQGDTAMSENYLDRAMATAIGDAQALVDASRLYAYAGREQEALALLEQAVEAEPTHFYARFALGNILSKIGRMDEALYHYEKSLRGNPGPIATYVNMGTIYLSRGDSRRAAESFTMALEADTTNALANLGMASILRDSSDPRGALAHIDRAIAANPEYSPAYHAKTLVLMETGESQAAHLTIRQGLALAPRDATLLSDLGLYYLRTDMPDSASKYFEAALEITPSMLPARGNLAFAYELMGLDSEAIEQYEIYLSKAPPGRSREMAMEALRRLGKDAGPAD